MKLIITFADEKLLDTIEFYMLNNSKIDYSIVVSYINCIKPRLHRYQAFGQKFIGSNLRMMNDTSIIAITQCFGDDHQLVIAVRDHFITTYRFWGLYYFLQEISIDRKECFLLVLEKCKETPHLQYRLEEMIERFPELEKLGSVI